MKKKLKPLWSRVDIVNAALVVNVVHEKNQHVTFDIAVDGIVVDSTFEWLDADLRLVVEDCQLDADTVYCDAVATALGDDRERYDEASDDRSGVIGDIAYMVWEKLVVVVENLRMPNSSEAA